MFSAQEDYLQELESKEHPPIVSNFCTNSPLKTVFKLSAGFPL